MGNLVVHVELVGKDTRTLQQFYADLVDWKIGEPIAETCDLVHR